MADPSKPSKPFHRKCLDLAEQFLQAEYAEHFLQDEYKDEFTESDARDLAQDIKNAIEDWFEGRQHESGQ